MRPAPGGITWGDPIIESNLMRQPKPRLSRGEQRKLASELMARLRERIQLPPFKFCRRCQCVKALADFAADQRQPAGYATTCTSCRAPKRRTPERVPP